MEDAGDFTLDTFCKASDKYRKDTKGSDVWTISEIKGLPSIAKGALADAIDLSVKSVALPHQSLVSLNALLGKPGGGIRTITKTPLTYRITNRGRTNVRDWERNHVQSYDSVPNGSSAS